MEDRQAMLIEKLVNRHNALVDNSRKLYSQALSPATWHDKEFWKDTSSALCEAQAASCFSSVLLLLKNILTLAAANNKIMADVASLLTDDAVLVFLGSLELAKFLEEQALTTDHRQSFYNNMDNIPTC